jgi:hypothetical protein
MHVMGQGEYARLRAGAGCQPSGYWPMDTWAIVACIYGVDRQGRRAWPGVGVERQQQQQLAKSVVVGCW